MPTFRPPSIAATPRFTADSTPIQRALFKYYQPFQRGVNVYLLQDGTYVQDAPTPGHANTAVPYPMFAPGNFVSRRWDPLTLTEDDQPVVNPVVKIYSGGHEIEVTDEEAAALTNAGYGANIT